MEALAKLVNVIVHGNKLVSLSVLGTTVVAAAGIGVYVLDSQTNLAQKAEIVSTQVVTSGTVLPGQVFEPRPGVSCSLTQAFPQCMEFSPLGYLCQKLCCGYRSYTKAGGFVCHPNPPGTAPPVDLEIAQSPSCSANPGVGQDTDFYVSWYGTAPSTNYGEARYTIQISDSSNFSNYRIRYIFEDISTTDFSHIGNIQFRFIQGSNKYYILDFSGSQPSEFEQGKQYYVRINNGKDSQPVTFTFPSCGQSTPPSPTPPLVRGGQALTPYSNISAMCIGKDASGCTRLRVSWDDIVDKYNPVPKDPPDPDIPLQNAKWMFVRADDLRDGWNGGREIKDNLLSKDIYGNQIPGTTNYDSSNWVHIKGEPFADLNVTGGSVYKISVQGTMLDGPGSYTDDDALTPMFDKAYREAGPIKRIGEITLFRNVPVHTIPFDGKGYKIPQSRISVQCGVKSGTKCLTIRVSWGDSREMYSGLPDGWRPKWFLVRANETKNPYWFGGYKSRPCEDANVTDPSNINCVKNLDTTEWNKVSGQYYADLPIPDGGNNYTISLQALLIDGPSIYPGDMEFLDTFYKAYGPPDNRIPISRTGEIFLFDNLNVNSLTQDSCMTRNSQTCNSDSNCQHNTETNTCWNKNTPDVIMRNWPVNQTNSVSSVSPTSPPTTIGNGGLGLGWYNPLTGETIASDPNQTPTPSVSSDNEPANSNPGNLWDWMLSLFGSNK